MNEKYLIGVDLGTTAIKAALFDSKGKKIIAREKEHKLLTPAALTVEQDADVYWETFCHCVKSVAAESGVDKNDIAAISLSAQGRPSCFWIKTISRFTTLLYGWIPVPKRRRKSSIPGFPRRKCSA
jgi:sugar (pentulose or hexulose) kinase